MSETVTVELRLLDQFFKFATTEDKREDLERAGELLNEKFREARSKAPRVENPKLAVLVALELMQEVLTLNKSVQEYEQCERLLREIVQDVEEVI